ncbi:MAG: C39 family peptidase [Microcoleaceae cyanobacterium]
MKYSLKFKSNSQLKRFPLPTDQLKPGDIIDKKAGEVISISDYTLNLQGGYVRVILDEFDPETISVETVKEQYYCLNHEIEITTVELLSQPTTTGQQLSLSRPAQVDLKKVPYHTQLNNKYEPSGTCNVTCVAMVLKYYEVDSRTASDLENKVQLEDILYLKTKTWDEFYGYTGGTKTRHEPSFLIKLLREWGQKYGKGILRDSYFKAAATEEEIKQHIAQENPVIIHGYFTHYGHIIVVRGYDDTTGEWICNDPNGKWLGTPGKYDKNASGEGVRYRYTSVHEVCHIGGGIWCHFPIPQVLQG